MIEAALYEMLTTAPDVAAFIDARCYPVISPVDTPLPSIVYSMVSNQRVQSLTGPSGLYHPRFQITCSGRTYKEAKQLANSVDTALDGASGVWAGLRIHGVEVDDVNDLNFFDDIETYQVAVDVLIWYWPA